MQTTIAQAHALNTPEANLMHRMAHIQRMEELVHSITEEGTQARTDLEAHVDNLRVEIHAVYRAEKQDQLRNAKLYAVKARVEALPEDGPIYQASPDATHFVVSDGQPHPSWEGRTPEMEDSFTERLPNVQPGLLARAWAAVKGVFHRAAH
ncbi:hypothetical protein [Ralstonia phage p2106]|uniref:Uncharacterized protein n=1 Tax=Ralstonia phage p2106 TaxID=2998497 RepID=A0AAF0AHB9_9CAUD|nr:hypothetical protein [Ralstonia phage p2106]